MVGCGNTGIYDPYPVNVSRVLKISFISMFDITPKIVASI